MDKEKLSTTSQTRIESTHRTNMQLIQSILLIWLDSNISKNTPDCQQTINELRQIVNSINTFTNDRECINFLNTINDGNICMIISGELGQHIVSQIHDLPQVNTIFIFCGNKQYHDTWAKNWIKIKGVFTDIMSICEALKHTAHQSERDSISISFMKTNVTSPKDQIESSFMYRMVLKEILLTIKFEREQIKKCFEYYRNMFADNDKELQNINKFEQERFLMSPVWWYTYECFLYSMVNRDLQLFDIDIIINMGFFIADLQQQIIDLHEEQFLAQKLNRQFVVYRGQGMTKTQFNELQQTKGGLLSFNNFLSASKNYDVSIPFAVNGARNPDCVGILFVMTIRPDQTMSPFASIAHINKHRLDQDEILFAMNSIFRINNIKSIDDNPNVFRVELTLPNDDDQDFQTLTSYIQEETFPNETGWYRLALILQYMNQTKKAQRIYEILLEQTIENDAKAPLYDELGNIKLQQNEHKDAISFYEKALAIKEQSLPHNRSSMADSYSNIGFVYFSIGKYAKALSYYKQGLSIYQQSFPYNHLNLAVSYDNIGNVYFTMNKYTKALSYYEQALSIDQQLLPHNHPDLAATYNNIGNVYYKMGQYTKALSYYEQSLAIRQQSLSVNHPDLASSYNNIGLVYFNIADYDKALSSLKKSLAIRQQSLSPNDLCLASSYNNIGNVYFNIGDYDKALFNYEKSLTIRKKSLPVNHPDLAISYDNIGNVYHNTNEHTTALSYYEKSLAIREQSLSVDDSNSSSHDNNIGLIYHKMHEYIKKLSDYEQSFHLNHFNKTASYNNIGLLFHNMNEYSKTLSDYEQSLPSYDPDLAIRHKNIRTTFELIRKYSNIYSLYQQTFDTEENLLPEDTIAII